MSFEEHIISVLVSIISAIGGAGMYIFKRTMSRLNNIDEKIDSKVSLTDMHTYVNDKHSAIIRDIDEQRDRMIAMASQINRIMELLIEIKNGKK